MLDAYYLVTDIGKAPTQKNQIAALAKALDCEAPEVVRVAIDLLWHMHSLEDCCPTEELTALGITLRCKEEEKIDG